MSKLFTLALVALLCVPLAACRSRARNTADACNPCAPLCDPCDPCQPAPLACQPPPGVCAPGPMVYQPPPAPTAYPSNSPSAREYDAVVSDLNASVVRNEDAERVLNQQERQLVELREEIDEPQDGARLSDVLARR